MPRLLRLLPFMLAALLLSGCNPAPTIGHGGVPRPPYRKVVSLSPGTSEILGLFITFHESFVGRTASDDYPPTNAQIPVVASVKPDYEKLAQLKPDLIVYDEALYNEADVEKLKQLGARLFVINADTVEGLMEQYRALGKEISTESRLSEYADKIHYERQNAMANAPKPPPKVAVLLPGNGSEHMIAGKDSFQADLVRSSGGEPVGPPGNRFVPLNAESLIAMNPDIIVVAGMPDKVAADPRLKTIKAVVSNHVYGTGTTRNVQDILLRRGSRVVEAIKFLSTAITRK